MFYDTGAYLAEGLDGAFLVERSPVYSLLLFFTGGGFSLWPVVILQALMTAYLIALTARASKCQRLSLAGLIVIGVALMLATGIGWYVGPGRARLHDAPWWCWALICFCFAAGCWARQRAVLVVAITGLAVACHPSHLGLIGGFLIVGVACVVFGRLLAAICRGPV